jgi:3-oxoacyl-[acyl-carrier protein] reductase
MGRSTAFVFAREGARVAVTDISADAAARVAADIVAEGGVARAWPFDVADGQRIARLVPEIAGELGGIDILINNAGVARFLKLDAPDYDESWHWHLGILLSAHQRIIRAALPFLRAAANPRIVNIASTEGLGATSGNSAYCAAKSGVIGLTRALAVELGAEGITVNCICPGPILTGMTESIADDAKLIYAKRRTALRRYGRPEEVAHVTLSLCIPAASYITGAIIPVDGGLMARNA